MAQSPQSTDPSISTDPTSPTAAQIHAFNSATQNVGDLRRFALREEIKHVPKILLPDEMPEQALAVEYDGHDACLLVVTNLRFMFITDKLFSFKKLVQHYPCSAVTKIEWSPGRARHKIVIHMGDKKKECYGFGGEQFQTRKMAEWLSSKVPGGSKSFAKDARTAKAHALEDMARSNQPRIMGAELKSLPDLLEEDEMPTWMFDGVKYDDLPGLNVSKGNQPFGLLTVTDRRLLHVSKEPLSKPVAATFPFEDIEWVTYTDGLIFGSITVGGRGREEKFDKLLSHEVKDVVAYLEEKMKDAGASSYEEGDLTKEDQGDEVVITTESFGAYIDALAHTLVEADAWNPGLSRTILEKVMHRIETSVTSGIIPADQIDTVRATHVLVVRAVERHR